MKIIYSLYSGQNIPDHDLEERVENMRKSHTRQPFDEKIIAALSALSSNLMKDRSVPPAFTALGYWLRPAALMQYKKQFETGLVDNCIAAPRGVSFHLPPTNVDTIFVYSWALSLLVGNANIVRLPSNMSPILVNLLNRVQSALRENQLEAANDFVSYPLDCDTTEALCQYCDTRIIWGGDAKVNSIREFAMKPGGISIPFPDRYSYAMINVSKFCSASDADRNALAAKVYNDIYLFDQMACSSSRLMFWYSDNNDINWQDLANDFMIRCTASARGRNYQIESAVRTAKFLFANQIAIDLDTQKIDFEDPLLTSIYLNSGTSPKRVSQGGGSLVHIGINKLDDIAAFAQGMDQTLTHFGFEKETILELARKLNGRGIDRIVPIGDALQFDRIWDGFDLLRSFSKLIVVR